MVTLNGFIPLASTLVTLLILFANIYYVIKFKESVDIQRKTSQGGLLMQINNQFFYNDLHKRIIDRLDRGGKLRAAPNVTHGFSDTDLDNHIGMLDTIGTFVRAQILDESLVYELFSHYILSAYEFPEIAEYIRECQAIGPHYFKDFIWIAQRMKVVRKNQGTHRKP